MNSLCSAHSHGFHKTNAVVVTTAPTAFTSISVSTISTTSFSVSWVGATGASSYVYYLNGTPVTPSTDNGVSSNTATYTGLTAGNRYSIYIKATNAYGTTWSIILPNAYAGGSSVWLDGADLTTVTTSGSNVSQWTDKTSSLQFTTTASSALTSGAQSSTNTSKTMICTGSQTGLLCSSFVFPATFTAIIYGFTSAGSWSRMIGSTTDGRMLFGGNPTFTCWLGNGGWSNTTSFPTGISVAGYSTMIGTNSNLTVNGYVNGNNCGTTTSSSAFTTFTGFEVCGSYNASNQNVQGNISEVIIYNSVLSTTNRQYLEGYLAWKYGTQASLVSGHPYLSSPPLGIAVWNP